MRFLVVGLLLAGLLGSAAAVMPLATVLELAGLPAGSLSWASAEGTLISGKLHRLRREGILIGDLEMSLRPASLGRLALEYELDWQGPAGAGSGRLEARPGGEIVLRDLNIDLSLERLEGLAIWIRQSGARARIQADLIRFSHGACLEASGDAWSDALSRNEAFLGKGWHELSGDLHCSGDELVIPVAAAGPDGVSARALARLGLASGARIEATLAGSLSDDLRHLARLAGFREDASGLRFSQTFEHAPAP